VTHLGQRLSALIDGELDPDDRDRVLVHLAKCDGCRGEAIALRTLKRRMSALGDETAADGALTRRLMGLAYAEEGFLPAGRFPAAGAQLAAAGPGGSRWPESRPGWYFGAGAVAVFLAGISTAAFMVGGSAQVPAPRVTPAVDSYYLEHEMVTGLRVAGTRRAAGEPETPVAQPGTSSQSGTSAPQPAQSATARAAVIPFAPAGADALTAGTDQYSGSVARISQYFGTKAALHSP
jgi:hypothetical protein